MADNSLSFGHLNVLIRKGKSQFGLPTHILILRADLSVEISIWTTSNEFERDLEPGVYIIRIFFSSQLQGEQIIEIISNDTMNIEIRSIRYRDINVVPSEWEEFYLVKNIFRERRKNLHSKKHLFRIDSELKYTCKIWEFNSNNNWRIVNIPLTTKSHKNFIGEVIKFESGNKMQIIEVNAYGRNSKFVCLPSSNNLSILITSDYPLFFKSSRIRISILISNKLAQTLLTLISSKDIISAKTLVSNQNAEDLLQRKLEDPVAAAIAGYYLLKVNELDRMHNWANNLANWFSFMPDGSIIHAWQMIQENKLDDIKISKIRSRLLEAIDRGIPIFTEGLKRLYEGLNMFRYRTKGEDREINRALSFIEPYMTYCDLSQELTTFNGLFPWMPEEYNGY